MKNRNGFVSNSSSASFIITPEVVKELKLVRESIDWFFDEEFGDYDEGTIELSTECSDDKERMMYEVLSTLTDAKYSRNS